MENTFIKIKSVFLALVVLFASNSYAITSHFCGERLVAISYFGSDVSCAMETTGDDCDDETIVEKKCCSDVVTLIEAEEFNTTLQFTVGKKLALFAVAFIESYIDLFQKRIVFENEIFKDFPPPDVQQDIQILHQTFLI